MKRLLAAAAALAVIGCGSRPGPDSWLLVIEGDTITTCEAGQEWISLDSSSRAHFEQSDNTIGEFVLALARRAMLEREVERMGYLDRPALVFARLSRAREIMCRLMRDSVAAETGDPTGGGLDSLLRSRWEADRPAFDRRAFEKLAGWFAGDSSFSPGDTLVTSAWGTWTAAQMAAEIDVERSAGFVFPADTAWLYTFAGVLVNRSATAGEFAARHPARADSVLRASRDWVMPMAVDSLFFDTVASGLEVTDEMLDSAWAADPPLIPEKRVIQCVVVPPDSLEGFRRAIAAGTAAEASAGLGWVPALSNALQPGQITRPLLSAEIPLGLGGAVFDLDPADTTTWLGPAPYAGGSGHLAVRLVEVIPEHESAREEAVELLERRILEAALERRLDAWLAEMDERYGLEINEAILADLPEDPASWTDF